MAPTRCLHPAFPFPAHVLACHLHLLLCPAPCIHTSGNSRLWWGRTVTAPPASCTGFSSSGEATPRTRALLRPCGTPASWNPPQRHTTRQAHAGGLAPCHTQGLEAEGHEETGIGLGRWWQGCGPGGCVHCRMCITCVCVCACMWRTRLRLFLVLFLRLSKRWVLLHIVVLPALSSAPLVS